MLWAICDSIVDGYEEVADQVEIDVDEIETSVFSPERTSDAERIYTLKREVLEMRRAIIPLHEPMESFAHAAVPLISREAAPFFRDVADHVIRVSDQTEALDTLLSSALNAHLARVSVQQNDDMRKISAWVAIAAAPDDDRRHLRHELPPHARTSRSLGLLRRDSPHARHLHHHVRLLPPRRLAVAGVRVQVAVIVLVASSIRMTMPSSTR